MVKVKDMTEEELIDYIYNSWNGVFDKETIKILLNEWNKISN